MDYHHNQDFADLKCHFHLIIFQHKIFHIFFPSICCKYFSFLDIRIFCNPIDQFNQFSPFAQGEEDIRDIFRTKLGLSGKNSLVGGPIIGKKRDLGILDPMIFWGKIRKNKKNVRKNTLQVKFCENLGKILQKIRKISFEIFF